MTNVVTLELTGDEDSLEAAIARTTKQVQAMDQTVAASAGSIEQSSTRMDRMAERADNLATRTGTLAGGIGALAGGMALLGVSADSTAAKVVGGLSVAIGTLSGIADIAAIALTSQRVAMVAHKAATVAGAAATGVATAAQWAWNIALTANPIGLVVAAVVLLIGVIVLIATKTTWFQTVWRVAWEGIKVAALAVANFFVNTVWHGGIEKAINWIGDGVGRVKDWFASIPGRIASAFSGLVNIITWPYRTAFNLISDAWNNTIGKLRWTVPSWVPGIGGKTISAPTLPRYHTGGFVTGPGPVGSEVVIKALVGERVVPVGGPPGDSVTHVTYNITVQGNRFRDGTEFEDWLSDLRNDGRGGGEVTE